MRAHEKKITSPRGNDNGSVGRQTGLGIVKVRSEELGVVAVRSEELGVPCGEGFKRRIKVKKHL